MKIGIRQQAIGNRGKIKAIVVALFALLFLLGPSAQTQQPNVPRIGSKVAASRLLEVIVRKMNHPTVNSN
jgi:hypothetical protein